MSDIIRKLKKAGYVLNSYGKQSALLESEVATVPEKKSHPTLKSVARSSRLP